MLPFQMNTFQGHNPVHHGGARGEGQLRPYEARRLGRQTTEPGYRHIQIRLNRAFAIALRMTANLQLTIDGRSLGRQEGGNTIHMQLKIRGKAPQSRIHIGIFKTDTHARHGHVKILNPPHRKIGALGLNVHLERSPEVRSLWYANFPCFQSHNNIFQTAETLFKPGPGLKGHVFKACPLSHEATYHGDHRDIRLHERTLGRDPHGPQILDRDPGPPQKRCNIHTGNQSPHIHALFFDVGIPF